MSNFPVIPEVVDPYARPAVVDPIWYYNLQNQSWGIPRKDKDGVLADPIQIYMRFLKIVPSNYETVWTGLQYRAVTSDSTPYERMFTNLYQEVLGSETIAAKGYYVIDLLRRGASRVTAYNNNKNKYPELDSPALTVPADYTPQGASVVAAFAGRVFYAGFGGKVVDGDIFSPNLSNTIAFSQLIKNKVNFFKCYQEGDPTSRDGSDIVDTDGGFLKIAEADRIVSMVPLDNALVVIASNGVWAVQGGGDYGFTATNYQVKRLSAFSGVAENTVVREGDRIYFWGQDGIYVISRNQMGDLGVMNISIGTIQTLYQDIPFEAKKNAFGIYDSVEKTIKWIYRIGEEFTDESETYELIFHTVFEAFTQNRIYNHPLNDREVFGLLSSSDFKIITSFSEVEAGVERVWVDSSSVVAEQEGRLEKSQSTRYLVITKPTSGNVAISFGFYKDTGFRDWGTTDASAFMITGESIASDSSVAKQIPYLTMHFIRTENEIGTDGVPLTPSGCLVQVSWDWANSNRNKKFGQAFQTYRNRNWYYDSVSYNDGLEVLSTKSKVRGMGKAFSMNIMTEVGKDCRLLGWNLNVIGNEKT